MWAVIVSLERLRGGLSVNPFVGATHNLQAPRKDSCEGAIKAI